MDTDVVGARDHTVQQARVEPLRDQGEGQEGGEPVAVAPAGGYPRLLREPLDVAGLDELRRYDEQILDVFDNDGVDPALAGVEPGEVREVCL